MELVKNIEGPLPLSKIRPVKFNQGGGRFLNLRTILSSLQTTKANEAGKISLKQGQVFLGRVLKLFPKDQALVQLGGLQVHAKLEAELEAGKSYWLQVANSSGTPELKVLDGRETGKAAEQPMKALLQKIGLSPTKTREAVIRTFINNNIPFTREMVAKSGEWLNMDGNQPDALSVLKEMVKQQLPFSQHVFESLLSERHGEPLNQKIVQLSEALKKENVSGKSSKQLLELLPQLTVEATSSASTFRKSLERVLSLFGLSYEHQLLQIAKPTESNQDSLKQILQLISQDSHSEKLQQEANQLLSELNKQPSMSAVEIQKAIQPELEQTIAKFAGSMNPSDSNQTPSKLTDTLKPLLMQVIQHTESESDHVKQQAQQLLHQLTAQQLNGSGPFQTMMQFPLQTGTHQSTAMLKWEGKKNKEGHFDPDFCRILFYLDLEHLKQTAVDVNIQKRHVTIRIYNETLELKELIVRLEPMLKKNLESAGYHLSSLQQTKGVHPESERPGKGQTKDGVDLRI